MNNVENINTLLQNVTGVLVKYEPIHREHRFNIFSILRHGHEEVALHSRFIAELLNPKGKHGHGDEFLNLFLRLIDAGEPESTEEQPRRSTVEIERWFHIDDPDGRIDILIRTPSHIVVIENKIYASDQDRQLDRYYKFALEESGRSPQRQPVVCYLTLQGDVPDPSTWSGGSEHSALRRLSYKKIRNWLDDCLGRAVFEPALRETIHQYQLLIDKLRGETMANDEKAEVIAAITTNRESVMAAKAIHDKWHDALTEGILKYWRDLEKRCRDELIEKENDQRVKLPSELINRLTYSRKRIKNIFDCKRVKKKEKNHGLIIPIGKYEQAFVCLYIEAEAAYQQGMLFGIRMVEVLQDQSFKYTINKEKRYDDLAKQLAPVGFTRTEHWLAFQQLRNVPDITNSDNDDVVELMFEENRKEAVDATMQQVKELYDHVNTRLPKT